MADQGNHVDEVRQAAGRALLALTDRFGFDAYAAGWLHDRAGGTWRYLLVTPMLKTRGPRWVYERLMRLLRHHQMPVMISPADIYVLDQTMEFAAFGEPWVAFDDRNTPEGTHVLVTGDASMGSFQGVDGFVAFHRRLPKELRVGRADPARRFDARVRQLDKAT